MTAELQMIQETINETIKACDAHLDAVRRNRLIKSRKRLEDKILEKLEIKCTEEALFRYAWPGRDQRYCCLDHAFLVTNIANAPWASCATH